MATILLTAVGTAVGGPIGAAVGAAIGYGLDARLLAPKARHGPRLGDLAVQSSSYGTPIPKLFGTMRVAGTVIWSTDLQERKSTSGGGKGRPKTVDYSYSASFAVALSGRPIRAVRRIWADGKLLRGSAGDFKTATKFRLYPGGEDQAVDPLIASVEGLGETPAFRGIAFAMFENFKLADYGNRIPSLSFEVEADAGPMTMGEVAEELSEGAVEAGASPGLRGYAASGDSIRGAIQELAEFVPLSLVDVGQKLRLATGQGEAILIDGAKGETRSSGAGGRDEHLRQAAAAIATSVTLAYHDPVRDFQTGLQRAFRPGAALIAEQRALAVALQADEAKLIVEGRLAALWAGRARATLHRSWADAVLRPGMRLRLAGKAGLWQVERWLLEAMIVRLHLVRVAGGGPAQASASSGRAVSEDDRRHGPTLLRVLELPTMGSQPSERPQLFVAAAGVEPGWRRAALMASFDGGASWQELGQTAPAAVLGTVESVLPPSGSGLLDCQSHCTVALAHEEMTLESRTDGALDGGANLALVGREIVQFGSADYLGDGRYRLSRLLRGRFGTEWAVTSHVAGEDFALLDRNCLLPLDAAIASIGAEAQVVASGLEDGPNGVKVTRAISGDAVRPPAPVHLRAKRSSDGDILVTWVRRSRVGWPWLDGNDAPLGEEQELYGVAISGSGFRREISSAVPAYTYRSADQVLDGAGGAIRIEVSQVGTHGPSRQAHLTIHI